jgi:hypothetical protein
MRDKKIIRVLEIKKNSVRCLTCNYKYGLGYVQFVWNNPNQFHCECNDSKPCKTAVLVPKKKKDGE